MVIRQYRVCASCKEKKRTSVLKKEFICKRCKGFKNRLFSDFSGKEKFPFVLNEKDVLILLNLEKEALPIKKISNLTEIPLSSLYKRLSHLEVGGFIYKTDLLYFLTSSAKRKIINLKGWDLNKFLKRKSSQSSCLRFHSLQGKLSVLSPTLDYDKYFDKNYPEYYNKVIRIAVGRNKKETGFKLIVSHCIIVFFNPTSISITFPDILVNDVEDYRVAEGYAKLGLFIDSVIETLQRSFKGLKIDDFCPFGLDNQHIAIKDSVYAKRYYEKNRGYLNENNKIITDQSHKHHELEAIHPQTAGKDIEECLRREKEVLEVTSK